MAQYGLSGDHLSTVVLVRDGRVFLKSSAALRVLAGLPGLWKLAAGLLVVPRPLRDLAYSLVAAARYRLGRRRDRQTTPHTP